MPLAHNTTKGVGKTRKPALRPEPWTHPLPSPHIRNQLAPYSESVQGNLLLVFTPSCSRQSLSKALPEFLVCPLVHLYCLGKAENPGW